jgi:hypothetical protein
MNQLQTSLSRACTLLGLWFVFGNAIMQLTHTDTRNGHTVLLQTERQLQLSCTGRPNVKYRSSDASSTAYIPARILGSFFLETTILGLGALKLADCASENENLEGGDLTAPGMSSSREAERGMGATEEEKRKLNCCDAFIETTVKIGDGIKLGGEGMKLGGEGVKLGAEGLKVAGEGFSKGFKDIGFGAKVLSWSVSAWLANKIAVDWRLNDPLRNRGQNSPARP